MNRDEIVLQLKAYFEKSHPHGGAVLDENTDLLKDWLTDSLEIVETVLFLEKAFGIKLSAADINGTVFKDIKALSDVVVSRLANR